MKLFHINIGIKEKEITNFTVECNKGYVDTHKLVQSNLGHIILVYGVVKVNNAKEALDVGFKYIEENKLIL